MQEDTLEDFLCTNESFTWYRISFIKLINNSPSILQEPSQPLQFYNITFPIEI